MLPDLKTVWRRSLGALLLILTIGLATWQSVGYSLFSLGASPDGDFYYDEKGESEYLVARHG